MGFSVLLLLDMKPKSRLVSEDLIQIKYFNVIFPPKEKKKNKKAVLFVVRSKNSVRLVFRFGLVSCKDGSDLIWSLFSENGTAADALTEAPILQSCITTGIEVFLMCRRVCHNQIKEDSNLALSGFQTHDAVFSVLNFHVTRFRSLTGSVTVHYYFKMTCLN